MRIEPLQPDIGEVFQHGQKRLKCLERPPGWSDSKRCDSCNKKDCEILPPCSMRPDGTEVYFKEMQWWEKESDYANRK